MNFTLLLSLCCCTILAAHAQPAGTPAIEDAGFDAFVARRPVAVVKGKLLNTTPAELQQTLITYSVVTMLGQEQKSTQPATDGSFQLELTSSLPYQQIWFGIDELFYAGLYAQEELIVELDVAKIKASGKQLYWNGDGVRYLGKDAAVNVYMNDFIGWRRDEQLALGSRVHQLDRLANAKADEVVAALKPIYDSMKLIQQDYAAKHPSPYAWLLENERLSEYYGQLCVWHWFKNMDTVLMKQIRQHKTYLLSNSSTLLKRYLATYISVNPANRISVGVQDVAALPDLTAHEKALVDSLTNRKGSDSAFQVKRAGWWSQLQKRVQPLQVQRGLARSIRYTDSLFANQAQADAVKLCLNDSRDIDQQKVVLELLLPSLHTNWCRQLVQRKHEEAVEKIAAINKILAGDGAGVVAAGFGKPVLQTSFGASLYKVTNMKAADFLTNLRQSFTGKAIIFDLWATWCAPCLGEMPHSKKIQVEGKNLPVVFVYVCTESGSDEDKWKRKVAELEQPGIHFFIDKALDRDLMQHFSFNVYPSYAFIDRQGVYQPGKLKRVSEIGNLATLQKLLE